MERRTSRVKVQRPAWAIGLGVAGLATVLLLFSGRPTPATSNVTISAPTTFGSLDGSLLDADGSANGVFTVDGDLTITGTGSITCNDPSSPTGNSACPMTIHVTGNMEIQGGGSVLAENNFGT